MATVKEEVRVFTSREEFDEFKREKIESGELTEKDFEKIEAVMNEHDKPKAKSSFELVLEMSSELTDAICLCACIAAREPELIDRVTKLTKLKLLDFLTTRLFAIVTDDDKHNTELKVKDFLYELLFEARTMAEKTIEQHQLLKANKERGNATTH